MCTVDIGLLYMVNDSCANLEIYMSSPLYNILIHNRHSTTIIRTVKNLKQIKFYTKTYDVDGMESCKWGDVPRMLMMQKKTGVKW
jgi:hypothetical protein